MRPPDTFQTTVLFPLTVDADLSLTAQSILRHECGERLLIISPENLPDTHEVRLCLTLEATAYEAAVHAAIVGLPAAQFGRVKPVSCDELSLPKAA